jgi:hypothetical protein
MGDYRSVECGSQRFAQALDSRNPVPKFSSRILKIHNTTCESFLVSFRGAAINYRMS